MIDIIHWTPDRLSSMGNKPHIVWAKSTIHNKDGDPENQFLLVELVKFDGTLITPIYSIDESGIRLIKIINKEMLPHDFPYSSCGNYIKPVYSGKELVHVKRENVEERAKKIADTLSTITPIGVAS